MFFYNTASMFTFSTSTLLYSFPSCEILGFTCVKMPIGWEESVDALRRWGRAEKSERPTNQSDFCPRFRTGPYQRRQGALLALIGSPVQAPSGAFRLSVWSQEEKWCQRRKSLQWKSTSTFKTRTFDILLSFCVLICGNLSLFIPMRTSNTNQRCWKVWLITLRGILFWIDVKLFCHWRSCWRSWSPWIRKQIEKKVTGMYIWTKPRFQLMNRLLV